MIEISVLKISILKIQLLNQLWAQFNDTLDIRLRRHLSDVLFISLIGRNISVQINEQLNDHFAQYNKETRNE